MTSISAPSSEDLPDLKPGDLVAGRFRIVDILGSGGFSVVYRAHQEGMNRFVALKVLKPRASADDTIVERFRREALFASQLSHPNTITLFDYGETDTGLCYIAMEHLEGTDMSEVVKYGKPVDLKRVWSILAQACRSLSEAHRVGLIHRDLKPENIFLVDRNGSDHVKILDFGVSKALANFGPPKETNLASLTMEGTVFGTPLYMAPEQAMAEELTPAVDVYAMGHIAFEMITGRAAYEGETNPMDVMLQQINDPPLELPDPWHATPFAEVVRRSTLKDPYQRISDASELLEALMAEEFLPYMDDSEAPSKLRRVRSGRPLLDLPVADDEIDEEIDSEKVYRWELSILDDALKSVRESAQMRLVVLRGKPGTGRSNLLRAFLKRHKNASGLRIVHRQAFLDGKSFDAGLEADLAQAGGVPLMGEGIGEVNRLLREILTEPDLPTLTEMTPIRLDSNPLSRLSSRRDDFFTRLIEPFRRAARVGTLIWAIESLENVDPLTLAFLEHFIREMRLHPSPILIATTVHPDALIRRPGLMRYTESIVNAPSLYARHLRLMEPGTRKEGDEAADEKALRQLAEISSSATVDGSYLGKSIADSGDDRFDELDEDEIARWAALADGDSTPEDAVAAAPAAQGLVADEPPPRRIDTGPTQRLELFTTEETARTDFENADPEIHTAFDTVLGYLAQLDERVISRPLWEFVYHRVLPFEMTRVVSVILEHAKRFGIVVLTEEAIAFTDAQYASSLRETFDELTDAVDAHARLAELLNDYAPEPGREDLRRIVHHAVKGEDYERAFRLLLRAGDEAYEELDLDLAREYYLQFQSLIDELSTLSPTPSIVYTPYPRIWLRIGEIQGALGEYGAAEDALRRAIRETRNEDHRVRAASHKLLADLAMAQERYAEARTSYETARDLYKQTSLARPYVASIGEIGRCSVLLGRPRQAEGILLQAIDKADKLQDINLAARLHRYMGTVLTRQARFLEAIDHLKDAMQVFEQQEQHRDVVECLDELGQAHYAAGLYPESRDNFTQALAYLSTRHIQSEHSPHLGLARALAALENLEQAEIHLVEAMSHYSTRNQPVQRARVQYHLGDLYLAMGRAKIAEKHYGHVFELGRNVGHRQLAFDALIRRAYALFDQGDLENCFATLTRAVSFGEDTDDAERKIIPRAHIIYLQLLLHDFKARGDTFSTLLTDTDERTVHASHVLCDLFRADVAVSRQAYQEASNLLARTRLNVASIGEYGLFIPIARREYLLSKQLGRLTDPQGGAGYALGALLPPESRKRRFSAARFR